MALLSLTCLILARASVLTEPEYSDSSVILGGEDNKLITREGSSKLSDNHKNFFVATHSTISGGRSNIVSGSYANIAGGAMNSVISNFGSILGGYGNYAAGRFSSVIGGTANTASGRWSVAAGRKALALHTNSAAFGFKEESECKTSSDGEFKICAKKIILDAETVVTTGSSALEGPTNSGFDAIIERIDRLEKIQIQSEMTSTEEEATAYQIGDENALAVIQNEIQGLKTVLSSIQTEIDDLASIKFQLAEVIATAKANEEAIKSGKLGVGETAKCDENAKSVCTAANRSPCTGDSSTCGSCLNGFKEDDNKACKESSPDGKTREAAAISCRAIKSADSSATSGAYWIQPDKTKDAIQTWCDQETDGGGWTMVSQARAASGSPTLCANGAVNSLDVSNGYNMAKPTAKLSDTMINALLKENLISDSDVANSPEMMFAVHNPFGGEDNPAASMSKMWGQRCVLPIDGNKKWDSTLTSGWISKLGSRNQAFCYDQAGKEDTRTIVALSHEPTLCGLAVTMRLESGASQYAIWSATTAYDHVPCKGDTVGRIWTGSGTQGCRRGASYVRSSPPQAPSDAPTSCRHIKTINPDAKSGSYWIKPSSSKMAIKVWCDQETDGGGWTLVSQHRAAQASDVAKQTLCQGSSVGKLDTSTAYNIATPSAKLSDLMINVLLTEGLNNNQHSQSPQMMMAAHYHDSSHADPPASFEQPWGQRCVIPIDATNKWDSSTVKNWRAVPNPRTTITCFDKDGKSQSSTLKPFSHDPTLCGMAYAFDSQYIIWSATKDYTHAPCSNDDIGRIWVGKGNQGCRRGKTYVRSAKPPSCTCVNGKAGFSAATASVCDGKHYRLSHGVDPINNKVGGPRPFCKGSTSKGDGSGYNCHKDWGFVVKNGKRWWYPTCNEGDKCSNVPKNACQTGPTDFTPAGTSRNEGLDGCWTLIPFGGHLDGSKCQLIDVDGKGLPIPADQV